MANYLELNPLDPPFNGTYPVPENPGYGRSVSSQDINNTLEQLVLRDGGLWAAIQALNPTLANFSNALLINPRYYPTVSRQIPLTSFVPVGQLSLTPGWTLVDTGPDGSNLLIWKNFGTYGNSSAFPLVCDINVSDAYLAFIKQIDINLIGDGVNACVVQVWDMRTAAGDGYIVGSITDTANPAYHRISIGPGLNGTLNDGNWASAAWFGPILNDQRYVLKIVQPSAGSCNICSVQITFSKKSS